MEQKDFKMGMKMIFLFIFLTKIQLTDICSCAFESIG